MQFSVWRRHPAITRQASCLPSIFVILAVVVTGSKAYEETTLTCVFGENIGERGQAFKLLDGKEELALKCSWRRAKLWCVVGDGYSFDFEVSDTASVRRVQTPNSTKCSCFIMGNDNTEHERPCFLEVASDKISGEGNRLITDVSKDKPPLVFVRENQTEPLISQTNMEDGGSALIIALSTSCALISVLAVAFAVIAWKLRIRERRLHDRYRKKSSWTDSNVTEVTPVIVGQTIQL